MISLIALFVFVFNLISGKKRMKRGKKKGKEMSDV